MSDPFLNQHPLPVTNHHLPSKSLRRSLVHIRTLVELLSLALSLKPIIPFRANSIKLIKSLSLLSDRLARNSHIAHILGLLAFFLRSLIFGLNAFLRISLIFGLLAFITLLNLIHLVDHLGSLNFGPLTFLVSWASLSLSIQVIDLNAEFTRVFVVRNLRNPQTVL